MSAVGQTEKNSVRAYVFRFTPELGHCSSQSARLKRAKLGSRRSYSINSSARSSSGCGTVRQRAQTRRAFRRAGDRKAGEVPEQRRMPAQKEEALIASARAPATKITLGMMTDPRVIAQF